MSRQSDHINRRQGSTFLNATHAANQIGRPLNLFVTLNFAHTDCQPETVSAAFERLRDNHFGPWLRYLSSRPRRPDYGPPTYAWVIEQAAGMTHVHWLVHLPESLHRDFRVRVPLWLATVSGRVRCEPSAVNIKRIYSVSGLARYLMKGLEPKVARFYGVRPKPQGLVVGKRCGVSRNLGPAARRHHALQQAA